MSFFNVLFVHENPIVPMSVMQPFNSLGLSAAKKNEPFPRSCVKLIVNPGIRRETKPFPALPFKLCKS